MRVKFTKGNQRKFLSQVLLNSKCPSLRSLISRGFNIPYSTLKSYYNENRSLPKSLFENLCFFGNLNPSKIKPIFLEENWGQSKGGKK